jgi:biotin/methionine sulfoxide reductase
VQPADRLHSQMDPGPVAQANKIAGHEALTMHPNDAQRRGLKAGDRVRVFNARGACLAGLKLSSDQLPGVVIMATGAWFEPDNNPDAPERSGTANVLTRDIGTSTLTQGPNAMSCLVDVCRFP